MLPKGFCGYRFCRNLPPIALYILLRLNYFTYVLKIQYPVPVICCLSYFIIFKWNGSRFCVSSLIRGHVNILCFIRILVPWRFNRTKWYDCVMIPTVSYGYEVRQESYETDFLFTKVFIYFLNINVIPFKIVLLGSYTQMEALFLLLVAALEFFNRFKPQHVRCTLVDDFYKDVLERLRKGSFAWDQTLQTNVCSIMTSPHVTLPSPSQKVWPQKEFLWFHSLPIHLTSVPVTFSFFLNLKLSWNDVISGLTKFQKEINVHADECFQSVEQFNYCYRCSHAAHISHLRSLSCPRARTSRSMRLRRTTPYCTAISRGPVPTASGTLLPWASWELMDTLLLTSELYRWL